MEKVPLVHEYLSLQNQCVTVLGLRSCDTVLLKTANNTGVKAVKKRHPKAYLFLSA